jgi:hypothetical protein
MNEFYSPVDVIADLVVMATVIGLVAWLVREDRS